MKYFIWKLRRKLSRLFYKKWCFTILTENGWTRTEEIDPDKQDFDIVNIKTVDKI